MRPLSLSGSPSLPAALRGPVLDLEKRILDSQSRIEAWFRAQWLTGPAPFYASVDLRNAGFKLAPVDTNLFPAGFNNLNPAFLPLCYQAAEAAVDRLCPDARRLLLIPESHSRNLHYLESVATLEDILVRAGFDTRLGSIDPAVTEPHSVTLPSGRTIRLMPVLRRGNTLGVESFAPCVVLLNNDLSSGVPEILQNLEQPIVPPVEIGWHTRLKSVHFAEYQKVVKEFSNFIGIDPWLIDPMFGNCEEINFMTGEGGDCLRMSVADLLANIQRKYDEYKVTLRPYVVVKADAGTYGMAIMTAHSPDDVVDLNRKERTKMAATKGGRANTKVILQEGVYSMETWGEKQSVCEPVVYMIDRYVVGGFYRVHQARGPDENLNAPGMHFEPLAFADCCTNPDARQAPDAHPNRFYTYGVVARLALVAAAREIVRARAPAATHNATVA